MGDFQLIGGHKIVLKEQMSTFERQIHDYIKMNLAGHSKVKGIATLYLKPSLGFLSTPQQKRASHSCLKMHLTSVQNHQHNEDVSATESSQSPICG
eukprot:5274774-Ditylum_brightwellii.AAC.1